MARSPENTFRGNLRNRISAGIAAGGLTLILAGCDSSPVQPEPCAAFKNTGEEIVQPGNDFNPGKDPIDSIAVRFRDQDTVNFTGDGTLEGNKIKKDSRGKYIEVVGLPSVDKLEGLKDFSMPITGTANPNIAVAISAPETQGVVGFTSGCISVEHDSHGNAYSRIALQGK